MTWFRQGAVLYTGQQYKSCDVMLTAVVVMMAVLQTHVDGTLTVKKDGSLALQCGVPECVCKSEKSEVKVNCSGVTLAGKSGRRWTFPSNTSILIVENSDLTAFPWAVLSSLRHVRILRIHHCSVHEWTHLVPLQAANFSTNITDVSLRWNHIQKIDTGLLSIFPSVEHLYLGSNDITNIEAGCFRLVPKLACLDLSNNKVGPSLMRPAALSGLHHLRELKLENCSIKAFDRRAFNDLQNLRYLYLAHNQLSVIPVSALLAAPQLIFLHLAFNHIVHVDSAFSQLNRLQYLFLHNNGLEAIHPGALDGFDNLQQIVLNDNKLRSLPAGLQPAVLQMPRLDYVSLVNVTWRCDCSLLWLVRLEQKAVMTSSLSAPSLSRCFLPRHLAGVSLRDLSLRSLRCPKLAGCEEGQLSSVQCQWCPPFQKPLHGGTECMCMEGYEYDVNARPVCQPCPIGYFKVGVNKEQCHKCPENSSTLMVGASTCLCGMGYTQTARKTCEPCPANTYKAKLGNHMCHPCPLHSLGPPGSHSVLLCRCLQLNHYMNTDIPQCVSSLENNGFQRDFRQLGNENAGSRENNATMQLAKVTRTEVTIDPGPSTKSGVVVAISVGVSVVMAMLMALLVSLVCAKRLPCRKQSNFFVDSSDSTRCLEVTIEANIVSHGSPGSKLHIRRLRVGKLLGRGAFGQVHTGVLSASQNDVKKTFPVAVKRLKDKASEDEGKVLQEELEQMILVGPHPNIIQLIGSCVHEGNLHIIMELAEDGDLLTYLRQGKLRNEQYVSVGPDGTLREQQALLVTDHFDLMLFAWHIAKGMGYLESVKCIHRDLAARNCLLTAGPVAKLSDFGLSRDVYENGYYFRQFKGRVPYKWLSPEALLWGQYSSKSDVWSYGILLWEVATFGGTPYSGIPPDRIADMHRGRYRLPQPPACPNKLYRVMRSCWHEDPRKRPTFRTLCDVLEIFVEAAADIKYLDLQGQTHPTLPDVTPETEKPQPLSSAYANDTTTTAVSDNSSPHPGESIPPYKNHHSQQQQKDQDVGSSFPTSHGLSLKRYCRSHSPDLAGFALALGNAGGDGEEDSGGEMELSQDMIELQPMLTDGMCSQWSKADSSVPSHCDPWDEGKHGKRENNCTSGYSSSRSTMA